MRVTVVGPRARSIVRRCADLVPAVAGATTLAHRVGLRPARPAGCAEEVVSLVGSLG